MRLSSLLSDWTRPRPCDDARARRGLAVSGALCALFFLATLPLPRADGRLVGSDGAYYYATARSLALDGDLDFANDYALLGVGDDAERGIARTAAGRMANPFAIGAPLLWVPFLWLAHGASHLLNLVAAGGITVPLDGTGPLYEGAACLATILYASLGFLLAYGAARRLSGASPAACLLAVLALCWATPALYYLVFEPSMSHGITVFSLALFLAAWGDPRRERSLAGWALLGAATGVAALCRWQDGLIALVPIAEIAWKLARRELRPARGALAALAFGSACLLAFAPQLFMWRAVYGSWLTIPQGGGFLDWARPKPLQTLFSTRHGLFSWHPLYLLALAGCLPLWKKHRAAAFAVGFFFLGALYVNSAVTRWWADEAFGGRRFTSLLPLLAPPFAALAALAQNRWRRAFPTLLAALVLWNGLCIAQYALRRVSLRDALTWREMTVDRARLPLDLAREFARRL